MRWWFSSPAAGDPYQIAQFVRHRTHDTFVTLRNFVAYDVPWLIGLFRIVKVKLD
jgi:hypothetical protein